MTEADTNCYNAYMTNEPKYNIGEVAKELGRVPHTLRVWQNNNRLPEHLLPSRNPRGWREWTREQIEGLKDWVVTEDMTPGKAFRKRQ